MMLTRLRDRPPQDDADGRRPREREGFLSLARAMYLGFRRDRAAMFFTVVFPLLFLVTFGGLFGNQNTSTSKIIELGPVQVLDQAMARDAQGLGKVLTISRSGDRRDALEKVRKGEAAAAIEQRGNQIVVHYSAADQVKAATVQGVLQSIVQSADLAATGRPPTYSLTAQQVEDKSLKPIQFYTPGLLGWALASAGVFGAAQTLVAWRTKGILRRLRLSPVPIRDVFAARVGVSLLVAMVQMALFLLVAQLPMFGLKLARYWWMAVPVMIAGVLAFLAIGMLIGAWARTQEAAQAVTQLVIFPMAFLGGSFFPLDLAPRWLQALAYVFPLRYLNDGMLNVMGRGQGPASALPQIGILLAIAAVASLVARRLFRWDAA